MSLRKLLVCVGLFVVPWCIQAGQADTLSEEQIRELVRISADKDIENTKRQRDYTYVRRDERRNLDRNGRVKSTEARTYEITILAGERTEKLIAKNDKPLSEKEAKKEEEKIRKLVARTERESMRERRKRIEKSEKETEERREFVREVADAYRFRLVGTENVDGRPAWVIDADPLPGYKPRLKDAKMLTRFRFRAWVDQAEKQWVKLELESIDTISWGLILARIQKGTTIHLEQTRVNDEVWLPRHVALKLDARIGLLRNLDRELDVTFRDYQKFRAESVIRPLGEAP